MTFLTPDQTAAIQPCDIGYAEFCAAADDWDMRVRRGERLRAPEEWRTAGYFAIVDGVAYRYTGDA